MSAVIIIISAVTCSGACPDTRTWGKKACKIRVKIMARFLPQPRDRHT